MSKRRLIVLALDILAAISLVVGSAVLWGTGEAFITTGIMMILLAFEIERSQ